MICSDHPMFRNIGLEMSATVVPEKCPVACADAVCAVLGDATRYRQMSVATEDAWHRLECPVKWREMIEHWLQASPEDERLAGGEFAREWQVFQSGEIGQ